MNHAVSASKLPPDITTKQGVKGSPARGVHGDDMQRTQHAHTTDRNSDDRQKDHTLLTDMDIDGLDSRPLNPPTTSPKTKRGIFLA